MSSVGQHFLSRLRARDLALLADLAETLSIHRTSERLRISQPAASKALRELEETFGTRLFERHSHGVSPTPVTQMIIDRVRIVLNEMLKLRGDLEIFAGGAQGKVRVGIMQAAVPRLLRHISIAMANEAPSIVVEFREGGIEWMLSELTRGKLDCLIGRLDERTAAHPFTRETLFEEEVCVVARSNHPLAGIKEISPAILASADWIFPEGDTPLRHAIRSFFADRQMSIPSPRVESVSVLVNLEFLQNTDWLAFLPKELALLYTQLGVLCIIELKTEFFVPPLGLVLGPKVTHTPAVDVFTNIVRRCAVQISEKLHPGKH